MSKVAEANDGSKKVRLVLDKLFYEKLSMIYWLLKETNELNLGNPLHTLLGAVLTSVEADCVSHIQINELTGEQEQATREILENAIGESSLPR